MMLENHENLHVFDCSIASAAEPLNILYTVYPQQNQVAVPPPYDWLEQVISRGLFFREVRESTLLFLLIQIHL